MKLLFDFFPIILFFVTYKLKDIYFATGTAIVATIILFAWIYYKKQKPNIMQWFSLVIILVFGGLTIYLQNPTFIKWKPTILYLFMAGAIPIAHHAFNFSLLKKLMGEQMVLPDPVWTRLSWIWSAFFTFMAILNIWVAYTFSENFWVNFKLFGSIALMIVFVIIQSIILAPYIKDLDTKNTDGNGQKLPPNH